LKSAWEAILEKLKTTSKMGENDDRIGCAQAVSTLTEGSGYLRSALSRLDCRGGALGRWVGSR
jgi:hypothetical protein